MTDDVNKLRQLYHQSVAAFTTGDPDMQKRLWSQRDDVTLANPFGPPVRGQVELFQVMDRAASQLRDGTDYSFEIVSYVETADLAYEVGIQRFRARLGGAHEPAPVNLRVTTVFRRESDGWKVCHRHADALAGS